MRIVKVGGSLYDWARLGPALRTFVDDTPTLLVPGGGPLADVIRRCDAVHQLGETASHWLALATLAVNARFLLHLLPGAQLITEFDHPPQQGPGVVDMERFCRYDPSPLPSSWDVTSDSLAVRVADVFGASELVLLKSVELPASTSWDEASRRGIVDKYFPTALAENVRPLPVQLLNLRSWYESRALS
jgi:aspartokinase-like uncharacterized kinase